MRSLHLGSDEQRVAARREAFVLLRAVQAANVPDVDRVLLRATLAGPRTGVRRPEHTVEAARALADSGHEQREGAARSSQCSTIS